jgi:beta-phosphoglucomutase-like phosphatase (HAD superfamily)
VLVADGEKTRQAVSEALALVRKSRIPVVSFSGSRIQVMKHTYLKMDVIDQTGTSLYYLSDFTILKPDYLQ